jgi:predicted hotdog family 3-hydroxylacyl-ACP dehydratase
VTQHPPGSPGFPAIAELLPQRGPMVLLDSVVDVGERTIACTVHIGPDHAYLQGNSVDALLCVELVAQAVGAYAGLHDRLEGRTPGPGFLISCREATFEVPVLALGDELRVEARHVWGDDRLGSFVGRVLRGRVTLAEIEVGVYRGPIEGAAAARTGA